MKKKKMNECKQERKIRNAMNDELWRKKMRGKEEENKMNECEKKS